jgi:hypothetical protein
MKKSFIALIAMGCLAATVPALAADTDAALDKRISELITQLGNNDWNKRVEATEALKQIGEPALLQLKKAMQSDNAETASRAKFLVGLIGGKTPQNNPLAPQDAAGALQGAQANSKLLQQLFGSAPDGRLNPQLLQHLLPQQLPAQAGAGGGVIQGRVIVMDPTAQILQQTGEINLNALIQQALAATGAPGGQLQAQLLQQLLAQQGAAGPAANAPQPDALPSLDLLDTVGIKLSESDGGLRVTEVRAGTPAAKIGVMVGDLIEKVGGVQVQTLDDAQNAFGKITADKAIPIELTRVGQSVSLSIPPRQ